MSRNYIFFYAKTLLLFGLMTFFSVAYGQRFYSYITDRSFPQPNELNGYTFCPDLVGFEDGDSEKLLPGQICFNVSRNYLVVNGGEYEGAYCINTIKSEEFGYRMELMDARDPASQGDLKIFLNDSRQVDVLVFRKTQRAQQRVYYNAVQPAGEFKAEEEWFTNREQFFVRSDLDLWGNSIRPFHLLENGKQFRLRMRDSLEIRFTEKIDGEGKKEKRSYFASLRYLDLQDEDSDAESESFEVEFEIKKIKQLTGNPASGTEQSFVWELYSKEAPGGLILIYTNQKNAISMVEIGPRRYLVRGY